MCPNPAQHTVHLCPELPCQELQQPELPKALQPVFSSQMNSLSWLPTSPLTPQLFTTSCTFVFPLRAGVSDVMSQPKTREGFCHAKTRQKPRQGTDFPFLQISHPSLWQAGWQGRSEMSQTSSSRLWLIDHFSPPRGRAVSEGVPSLTEHNQSPNHSHGDAFLFFLYSLSFPSVHTHTHPSTSLQKEK